MTRHAPWIVAPLCFGVHVALMAPDLTWFDGGELALAAGTMGVAHPPGEPAWTALAALVALIPLGSLPFRLAVLSAATVAGAAGLLTALVGRIAARWFDGEGTIAGPIAGLCFGLGPAAVHQATRVELYGMMALLGVGAALLLERGGRRNVALAVLPLAVAGAVHHAMLVAALPGLVVLGLGRGRGSTKAALATASALVLPALGQFLWLPLRSAHAPPIDFGHPLDLHRTLWSVLARGYARSFHPVEGQLADNLAAHGAMLRLDLGDLGLGFAVLALGLALVRARRGALIAVLLVGVGILPTVLQGVFRVDNPDARGYLLGPWAVSCVGAGLGAAWALMQLRRRTEAARLVGLALVPLLVAPTLVRSLAVSDRADVQAPARLGNALLDEAPPGALVLPAGDSWAFPPLYARYWTGRRADLTVVPLHMLEPLTLDALARRGEPLATLDAPARARIDAAHRGLVAEATLAELLEAGVGPIVVNDAALPPELLRSRRPLGLLYALQAAEVEASQRRSPPPVPAGPDGLPATAAPPPSSRPTPSHSAEQALWRDTVRPLVDSPGFGRDGVAQDALSRRYASRAGWLRSQGFGAEALEGLERGAACAKDPWDTVHLWRHRLEQGQDPVGPQPALDARASAALELLFAGRLEEAGEAARSLLIEAPAHPWGLLAAERLYSLGLQVSPALAGPAAAD